jgi:hypothetical protein
MLVSHLLLFSFVPAFVVALIINAKLQHRTAQYVWIIPVLILIVVFVFFGPGMYPTMIWDSDFRTAFRHFFGGGFQLRDTRKPGSFGDWYRAAYQIRYSMPAYAGIAYSLGAWLGMSPKARGLQRVMQEI